MSVPGRRGSYKSVWAGRARRGRVPGFPHFPEKASDIGLKRLGEGAAAAPQIRGRASLVHGKGPEGSPGAGGCPGRAGKGREGSRVLSNAATDVLHEGPEAQGGGLGTRRLAAGEGLPGGRHRLGEHANSSSCLAPSGLRFCGDPPTILRARSASYASEACLGASEDASRPRARVRFECQFEFPSSFRCMRRRELTRAAMTIDEKSRRRPDACARWKTPRTMPVKISGRRRCTVWAFARPRGTTPAVVGRL